MIYRHRNGKETEIVRFEFSDMDDLAQSSYIRPDSREFRLIVRQLSPMHYINR